MEKEVTNNNKLKQSVPIRVLLVTSDREECGIREYGRMLMGAASSRGVQFQEYAHPRPEELLAAVATAAGAEKKTWMPEIIHLNHHAALHSGWDGRHVAQLQALGFGVVVTQHDTFESWEIMESRGFRDFRGADYLFVHERVEGLADPEKRGKVLQLNQPVPAVEMGEEVVPAAKVRDPVLGLFGFDFPWKGFDAAIQAAAAAGWMVQLFSNNLTVERGEELGRLHPEGLEIHPGFMEIEEVVKELSGCDATAFLYSTGNSGTSGAIRAGIAARRPLIASMGCRQFRDLEFDLLGAAAITWADSPGSVQKELELLADFPKYYGDCQKLVGELADRDSWKQAGWTYASCYRELATRLRGRGEDESR